MWKNAAAAVRFGASFAAAVVALLAWAALWVARKLIPPLDAWLYRREADAWAEAQDARYKAAIEGWPFAWSVDFGEVSDDPVTQADDEAVADWLQANMPGRHKRVSTYDGPFVASSRFWFRTEDDLETCRRQFAALEGRVRRSLVKRRADARLRWAGLAHQGATGHEVPYFPMHMMTEAQWLAADLSALVEAGPTFDPPLGGNPSAGAMALWLDGNATAAWTFGGTRFQFASRDDAARFEAEFGTGVLPGDVGKRA
jgi:hypothetical protein